MTNPRGRPRKFDAGVALRAAGDLFWKQGFSGTSLDQLAEAMGLNRPSMYNAFGDKRSLYRKALAAFCGQLDQGIEDTLMREGNFRLGLRKFYHRAIDLYCSSAPAPGCMMICTAPAEALVHPEVRSDLKELMDRVDKSLELRLREEITAGRLAGNVEPRLLARMIQGLLHTIALRARAGESKAALRKLARYGIETLL